MTCHAALGVVRAGVAALKGLTPHSCLATLAATETCRSGRTDSAIQTTGTGVRINNISPGQIDVGVDLKALDMRGMKAQLPPASLQSKEVQTQNIGLERAGMPTEVARVAGFLASGFSSYITGANLVVDGGAS